MSRRDAALAARLDELFARFHRPEAISPDPLQVVRRYPALPDREIAALVAASVAFGRVAHILRSVERVLGPMGPHPSAWLRETSDSQLRRRLAGWRHRWSTDEELCAILTAAREMQREFGSMGEAWRRSIHSSDQDAHETLIRWVTLLEARGVAPDNSLIPRPERASACKRLHLFLRWMIRHDALDPGGWPDAPARLLVPLDVHMHRIARAIGFTRRRGADLRTAREITAGFRRIAPGDPVRYDFALTRLGIQENMTARQIRALFKPECA